MGTKKSGVPDVHVAVLPAWRKTRCRSGKPFRSENKNGAERAAGKECGNPPVAKGSPLGEERMLDEARPATWSQRQFSAQGVRARPPSAERWPARGKAG